MKQTNRRGLMLAISSPSGAGKSTLTRYVMEKFDDIELSVSVTTRKPREGEVEGVHYHFIDKDLFEKYIEEDKFIEYAKVFDNYYGTLKSQVENSIDKGMDVIFDVDWQGVQQMSEYFFDDIVKIFILPPSIEELRNRLYTRASDSVDVIENRMKQAIDEISHYAEYEWVIINDDLEEAKDKLVSIIKSERVRLKRQKNISDFVNKLRH